MNTVTKKLAILTVLIAGCASLRGMDDKHYNYTSADKELIDAIKNNKANSTEELNDVMRALDNGANINMPLPEILDQNMLVVKIKVLDTRLKNVLSRNLLEWAIEKNSIQLFHLLLKSGIDYNKKDTFSNTPAHWIIRDGATSLSLPLSEKECLDFLELLYECVTNIDVKENEGYTPLHCAIREDLATVVDFLISRGADIYSRINPSGHNKADRRGKSTIDLANGNEAIIKIIKNKHNDLQLNFKRIALKRNLEKAYQELSYFHCNYNSSYPDNYVLYKLEPKTNESNQTYHIDRMTCKILKTYNDNNNTTYYTSNSLDPLSIDFNETILLSKNEHGKRQKEMENLWNNNKKASRFVTITGDDYAKAICIIDNDYIYMKHNNTYTFHRLKFNDSNEERACDGFTQDDNNDPKKMFNMASQRYASTKELFTILHNDTKTKTKMGQCINYFDTNLTYDSTHHRNL